MASCGFETEIFHCLLISLNVLKFSCLLQLSNLLYAVLYAGDYLHDSSVLIQNCLVLHINWYCE